MIRQLLTVATAIALAGCVVGRPADIGSTITAVPEGAVPLFDPTVDHDEVTATAGRNDLDVLVVSGGGAHGAFGAGVLNGWTESGTRPEFDVVTGVSTGALIAVPAFLGPGYDALLKKVYTTTHDSNVYSSRGIAGLFSTSLEDSGPLAGQIAAVVNETVLEQVAAEYAKGRRLYVATTNLDAGELVVWDLGKIASSGRPNSLQLFRTVLLASASIPGFFEPVYISPDGSTNGRVGQMHVDGSVKAPVLLRSWMVETKTLRKHVYVIVNGQLKRVASGGEVQPKLLSISARSISQLLDGLLNKTLYEAYVMTREERAEFRLTYVPNNDKVASATSFDPAAMMALFEVGRSLGATGTKKWPNQPPRLEDLEQIPTSG